MSIKDDVNKYQTILDALCTTDPAIDHAVLITAHRSNGGNRYNTTLSLYRCNTDKARRLIKDTAVKIEGPLQSDTLLQ